MNIFLHEFGNGFIEMRPTSMKIKVSRIVTDLTSRESRNAHGNNVRNILVCNISVAPLRREIRYVLIHQVYDPKLLVFHQ